MQLIKNVTIIIAFSMAMTQSFAANAGQQLLNLLGNINAMTANFTQKAVGGNAQLRQNTAGNMALMKPGRFLWDIRQPSVQKIVADGKKLWIYDVDLQQITVRNLQHSLGNSPALILSGDNKQLLKAYNVREVARKNGQRFSLTANNHNEVYRAIDLYFANGMLQKMDIVDNLGQRSIISFSQVNYHPRLANNMFQFKPPRGVDVIQQ